MPSSHLTAAAVERIKPPKTGQVDHFDKGFPGLALRVSYGGAKSWVYFFRLHGRLHRLTLGRSPALSLAEARDAWRDARTLVDRGDDPARHRPASADAFGAIAAEWLRRDQAENRTAASVARSLDYNVLPDWRDRPIESITRRDAIELIDRVADRGAATMARRLHAQLHRLFRWCVGRGILNVNPMADLPKAGTDVRRERVLTDSELVAVWKASDTLSWPFDALVKLLILTAARRAELSGLRWSEIAGDEIRLPGRRVKNETPQTIPLTPAATDIVKALPRFAGSEYVFTRTGHGRLEGWSRAKRRLDNASGGPDWRLHDLRRTCATGMQRLGVNLQVVEAVLGHISGSRAGVVGVYQRHTYDAEKKAALEAWARHVGTIVAGKPAKVVSLRAK